MTISESRRSAAYDDIERTERMLYQAAKRTPRHPFGWAQLALFLSGRGEHRRAVAVLWEAIANCGDEPVLLQSIADLLVDAPGHPDRVEALGRLANLQPDETAAQTNFGLEALLAPNPVGALGSLRRAVELGEARIDVLLCIASAELQMGSLARANSILNDVLAKDPHNSVALVERWFAGLSTLEWQRTSTLEAGVREVFETGNSLVAAPWMALALPVDDPERLRRFVERGSRSHLPGLGLRHAGQRRSDRIRVGYLSSDFHDHATTLLTRGLFREHGRSEFEVFGYSYGPHSAAERATDIAASVEHWHDISALGDDAAVALIRSHKLDALVEMKGHTSGARPEITRQRVCPIQIHYLGFPGPVGGFGVDYFVGDSVTIPLGAEAEINVPILRLPRAYQANDSQRFVPVAQTKRALGLSDDSILLANFNQLWKIRPEFMSIWCRTLRRHPRALLWLLSPSETNRPLVDCNLQDWLRFAGFEDVAERIVFVARLPNEEHLNRLAAVDLVLDQLPCGSHTTASDALWAGVPLLTVCGNTFAGRVASSLLTTHGEPSFITPSLETYELRLNELLAEGDELAVARRRFTAKRATSSLFDTTGFVRDWEAMLSAVCAEGQSDNGPGA